jgi:hypothetical protein
MRLISLKNRGRGSSLKRLVLLITVATMLVLSIVPATYASVLEPSMTPEEIAQAKAAWMLSLYRQDHVEDSCTQDEFVQVYGEQFGCYDAYAEYY